MLWSNAIGNTQSSSLNGYHSHCSIIYGFVYCTSSKMNGKCNEKLQNSDLSWIGWNGMEWNWVESSVQLFRQSRRAYRICVSFNYSLHLKDLHFLWFVVSLMNWKFKRMKRTWGRYDWWFDVSWRLTTVENGSSQIFRQQTNHQWRRNDVPNDIYIYI